MNPQEIDDISTTKQILSHHQLDTPPTYSVEISIEIQTFLFQETYLKLSSVK